MDIVQLVWEWYVFLFAVLVFIPALKFPLATYVTCLAAVTLAVWANEKGWM